MSLYTYNDDNVRKVTADKSWLSATNKYKKVAKEIIEKVFLPTNKNTPFYKILHLANDAITTHEYKKYTQIAEQIREHFDDVVIIGMGGAVLNSQSVLTLKSSQTLRPRIHFMHNTDPIVFSQLKAAIDLKKTAFLVISNSGMTLETLSITSAFINEYSTKQNLGKHFYFIIGAQESHLRTIANQMNATIFNHREGISGRFATFTNITILPGLIAGLNMKDFLTGATITFKEFWQNKEESIPVKSAISLLATDKKIVVNLGYLQAFSPFLEWYCQIIAESLGKNGQGYTPIRGIGPNDQHSMLQLYLDGSKDKLISFFYVKNIHETLNQSKSYKDNPLSYIAGKSLKEINDVEFQSTQAALSNRKVPIRTILLESLNEKSLGALMAHCMLEVIMLGHIMGVNPFNQPSVEEIKTIAQRLLKDS